MNRHNTLRILKPIWLFFLVATPVAIALLPSGSPAWIKAALVPSYLLWLIKIAYDNSDRVYFNVNRFFLFITNGQVRWTMSVEMTTALKLDAACDTAFTAIRKAWPSAAVWRNEPADKQIHLPGGGGLLRVRQAMFQTDPDDLGAALIVDLSDLLIPFRASTRTLEQITGIFESIRRQLQPQSEKYTLKVKFDASNPYYGLFIRQLRVPKQEIVSFLCDIDQHVGPERGRVAVSQERLALTTTSLSTLNTLSRRYITLASLDLTNP
jgi:hypothetical protein